ncbi:hypothetical protein SAMN05877838_2121 [Hoeflea halophila]|uniref:Uncharacterized protein n=1 Tax=Hoeflea halophila TaxID=714899 RepID=A0A286IC49_9HYPH|nr:hypothetical protein [Hoeflea halophila]SOE17226.1 hypothetical protein SAMN05877838_2121 [Hoeflea halophila]
MPVSSKEQDEIQRFVEGASAEERENALQAAYEKLSQVKHLADRKLLDNAEMRIGELSIEMIARIEAFEQGKGSFFRLKRRMQLAASIRKA